ncbi:MAG: NUDIX hydrolase [Planctomycetes bacterium]|nr:NUDIX hydrolase [Planctomycetota bacterium]
MTDFIHDNPYYSCVVEENTMRGLEGSAYYVIAMKKMSSLLAARRTSDGRFLMVKVYRHVIRESRWEFPAGQREPSESAREAAIREGVEESGYRATNVRVLAEFSPAYGIMRHTGSLCFGEVDSEPVGDFDTTEIDSVGWFDPSEILAMIKSGEIVDGFTLSAVSVLIAHDLFE